MFSLILAASIATPLPPKTSPPISETLPGAILLVWGGAEFDCEIDAKGGWWCCTPGGGMQWHGWIEFDAPDRITLVEAAWHPESGTSGPQYRYAIRFEGRDPTRGQRDGGHAVQFLRRPRKAPPVVLD